jgi:hypothetical protein
MEGRLGVEQFRRGGGPGLVWITTGSKRRRWGGSGSAEFGRGVVVAAYAGEKSGGSGDTGKKKRGKRVEDRGLVSK